MLQQSRVSSASSTAASSASPSGPSADPASPSGSSAVTHLAGKDDLVQAFDEDTYPLLKVIGSGSFATVYDLRGAAFKVVSNPTDNARLLHEYVQLKAMDRNCSPTTADSESQLYFCLPAVHAYYDPQTNELHYRSRRAPELYQSSSTSLGKEKMKSMFAVFRRICPGQAIYWMQRLTPVSYVIAKDIRLLCYPESFRTQPVPTICRLYLGRDHPNRTSRFFNQKNFPLDRERYGLLESEGLVPRAEFVAQAMGQALARLHWKCHNDARDVEFVLAGEQANGMELAFWVIDFNQTSSFITNAVLTSTPLDTTPATSHEMSRVLARPFFANDPYYPRPRIGDPLYERFKLGYFHGAGVENQTRAALFIHVIEEQQQEKDTREQEQDTRAQQMADIVE